MSSETSNEIDSTPIQGTPNVELSNSANGRLSGKGWKAQKTAIRRSHLSEVLKTSFEERMEKTQKEKAIKKLKMELKEEKNAEILRRREITAARKKAALERQQFEEMKAKMGARKAARLKRKAGRSKKVNG
ncbi:hypothetical protein Clacol_002959 [Clathrus columnatus]|uniref:rRNA-processing protein n=1 Tax=Clathrus columnatus TaxID=1419009 RepID=A0AAV5A9Z8_9AGAM|nr:hypothetical protein Clacol_002959 [Clathrus columnatus]